MISQHLYMFSFAKIKLNTTHHQFSFKDMTRATKRIKKTSDKKSTCSCDDGLIIYLLAAEVHANFPVSSQQQTILFFYCAHRKGVATLMHLKFQKKTLMHLCLMGWSRCILGSLMDQICITNYLAEDRCENCLFDTRRNRVCLFDTKK